MGINKVILFLWFLSGYFSKICDKNSKQLQQSLNVSKSYIDVLVVRFRGVGQISIRHSSDLSNNLIIANAKWKFQTQYEVSSTYLRIVDKSIHQYGRTHLQIEVGYSLKSWNWSIDMATISLLIILLAVTITCVVLKLRYKILSTFKCMQLSSKKTTGKKKRWRKQTYLSNVKSRANGEQTETVNEEIVEMININNFMDPVEICSNNQNPIFQYEKRNSFDEDSVENPDIIDTNSVNELLYKLQITQRKQFYRIMRTVFVFFCTILLMSIFLFVIYLSLNEDKNFDDRCYIQSVELTIPQSFETGVIEIYHSNLKDLQRDHEDHEYQTDENNLRVFNNLLPYLKQIPINIFSIDETNAAGYPICDANEICQIAWRQGRLGCDPISQKCLCTRGFQLYNGACIDINECMNEDVVLLCTQQNKVCLNTIGSYKCGCNKSESDNSNCQTCNHCPENQFDYHQCTDRKEAICIDIHNPLLSGNGEYLSPLEDRRNFKLTASKNVFSEDLLKLESMNSSAQISTVNQNFSFVFNRKSGLILEVNLYNVSINPTYEDVTHSGDNSIILKSTQGSSTYHLKSPLMNILQNYCRFPLPKYYYITMNEYRQRFTTAVKIICANRKYPENKVFCPNNYFDGQIYYFRTVNERCSSNKASKLPFDRNSFYCTQNTEFVNTIFNHKIEEKISASEKSVCDDYYKKCKSCFRNSCQNYSNKSQSCCGTSCYRNLACMAFYASKCYDSKFGSNIHAENICIKGDTLKFTLLPKFDFENESFLCHVKRRSETKAKVTVSLKLLIVEKDQNLWSSQPIFREINLENYNGEKIVDFLKLKWENNVEFENEMYLKGYQERGNKHMSYKLYRMKKKKDFVKMPMKLFKHQDSKYLLFQNGQPFHFSSENWFNFSCRLNPEDFFSIQDVYLPNYQYVKLINKNLKSNSHSKLPFQYSFDSLHNPAQINVELKNKSLISSFLCHERSGKLVLPKHNSDNSFLQLISLQWPHAWKIYFEGTVTDIPTFINVKIIDISGQSVLFDRDQIIHKSFYDTNQFLFNENFQEKPFQFINNFHFEKNYFSNFDSKNFGFQLEIRDCFRKYSFKLYYFTKIKLPNSFPNQTHFNNPKSNMVFFNISNKITSLTLCISLIYLLLIFFYILISIWKKLKNPEKIWDKIRPKIKQNKPTYANISCNRKVFMLLYVAFRVFYTFLFTLSVSLSLLLGIDSYSNEFYGNQQKIFNWINQESKQTNQISITELRRQFQYSTNMKKVCENQDYLKIKKLEKEILSSLNNSIQQWYNLHSKSVINQSIDFSTSSIFQFEDRIDKISDKLKFNIKSRFFDQYGQYQQLIKQYYYLQYFSFIQKVHNISQQQNNGNFPTENTNKTFVQISLMEFFNFLEIYETKSLNFYPFQNLRNLEKQFEVFKKHGDYWKNQFKGKPFKYKAKAKFKSYHRMFDTKYVNYHPNSLMFESGEKPHNSGKFNIKSVTTFKILKARIFLMVIDCFIVIYRFYNTFEILKWIFLGRKVYVFNSVPKDVETKKPIENFTRNQNDATKFPNQPNYGFLPFTELSLRIISQNRFPDWSLINQNPSSYSSCFKSRRYFQSFGQMHFIAVTIVFVLLVALLTFVIVTNYWYIRHYNPDVYKQNIEVLQKSQWLINLISKKISDYINNYALINSKIHNMNMSSLIINSSYLLTHSQKIVCQQLDWEIKSIRARSNTHSTLSFDICRLQSDVNFLPQLLMHISPCQFLGVLPINYTVSAMLFDNAANRSDSISKINQIIFLIILLIISVSTFMGSIQIIGNFLMKSVLGSSENNRYFYLTSSYPHSNSVKIHSSSSHSNQSARNIPISDRNSLLKCPLPTVTSGQFNDFSTSLQFFQLTATSESDV